MFAGSLLKPQNHWVLNRSGGFAAQSRQSLPYGRGSDLECLVFADAYRAATVRERLPETCSPTSVKHPEPLSDAHPEAARRKRRVLGHSGLGFAYFNIRWLWPAKL
jgi:hypothetical protein